MDTQHGTVVVIEDDPHIADLVDLYLRRDGYRVLLARDGEQGLAIIGQEEPWIVVLDVGLPGELDGFDVCRHIRAKGNLPVLFLTARDDEVDRILGLELGADDYLVKPFSPRELVARVRAILRRTRDVAPPQDVVGIGDLEVDLRRREARRGGEAVALTTPRVRSAGVPFGKYRSRPVPSPAPRWRLGRRLVRRRTHRRRPCGPTSQEAWREPALGHGVGRRLQVRMKGTLRRRLMTAFVGLVAGVLIIAGAGSIVLTHNAARKQATQQLVTEAQSLTAGASHTQRLVVLKTVRRVLRLADARFVRVGARGVVTSPLPPGLTSADLDPQALLSGETVSGRDGNLVFAAAPITLTSRERAQLGFGGQIAIVLTREVGDLGPSWGYFLVSGGVALLVAALVAWQLSRRLSRPLVEAMEATARIAAGDLDCQVPVRAHDYAESMSLGRSINEMAETLKEGRSRERHLLLSVSHELRTPLTSIRGFAEAITDGAVEDTTGAADVIIAESRRLERLVGDLLDLTKLEAKEMSMSLRPSDVAEVVQYNSRRIPATGRAKRRDTSWWRCRQRACDRRSSTPIAWRRFWPI